MEKGKRGRPSKDGVVINYKIKREVKEKLDRYCDDVGQTQTTAIERILSAHIDKWFANRKDGEFIV